MKKAKWLMLLVVFALVVAACGGETMTTSGDDGGTTETTAAATDGGGDDMDMSGTTVTILTPETDTELENFIATFEAFTAETGIAVEVEGTRDAADIITIRTEAGDPPDIFVFPQPGRIGDFAGAGDLVPLSADVQAVVEREL